MGSGISASASTRLTGASNWAGTLQPVLSPGQLRLGGLGDLVHEVVDARPLQELVQLLVPGITRATHILDLDPLLHHPQHGVPVQLGPDHLVGRLRVDGVQVIPDGPAESVLKVDLNCCSELREEAHAQRSVRVGPVLAQPLKLLVEGKVTGFQHSVTRVGPLVSQTKCI